MSAQVWWESPLRNPNTKRIRLRWWRYVWRSFFRYLAYFIGGGRTNRRLNRSIKALERLSQRIHDYSESVERRDGILYVSGNTDAEPILAETLLSREGVHVMLVWAPDGASMQYHRHNAHELFHLESGHMVVTLDDDSVVTLREGDSFHIPPNQIHSAHWIEDTTFVCVTVPRTTEYGGT